MPAALVSFWPTWSVPAIRGTVSATGLADVPEPAAATATVAGEVAPALTPAEAAATERTSAWPTSAAVGVYVSSVAPGIDVQPLPAASHRCHW